MEKTKLQRSHQNIGRLEAISFLLLLGIAMPLKYMINIPEAVSVVGWFHGLLFMGYLYLSWMLYDRKVIVLSSFALCFVAALIPFGPFVLEKRLSNTEV